MLDQGNFTERETRYRVDSIPFAEVKTETESEEQTLLKRLSQGDKSAFWPLWARHQHYLESRCRTWMGGNPTDAEEALSRASLKAWNKLPKHAEKIVNPKAWLIRLTYNLCVDIHREHKRGAVGIESIDEMAVAGNEIAASSSESPESAILRREMEMYIRRAIDNLPPGLRDAFILRCYQEMPYSDIAKQLALSNANVRKRIQKARGLLQKQLEKYLSGLDDSPASLPLPSSLKRGKLQEAELTPPLVGEGKGKSSVLARGAHSFPLVGERLGERLPEPSDELTISDSRIPMTVGCILEPINYGVTTTCLESLPHAWYSSPSLLGWR